MNRPELIKTACTALAYLLLAACAGDELTDGTAMDLPEGKYPLQIAGAQIVDGAQTRVSENTTDGKKSQWDGGEEITVQLSSTKADNTPHTATANYKLNDDKTTFSPVNGSALYWPSTNTGTVTARYFSPAYSTGNTVNLSNQANGLAYVLIAKDQNASYLNPISLNFTHQLAKVRVKLTGTKASDITSVKVKGYPRGTINDDGTVTTAGTETYLPMMKNTYADGDYYEANFAPQTIDAANFVQLTDPKNGTVTCSVSNVTTLDKAKCYLFNIEVNLNRQPITGGETITEPGGYIMTGNITQTVTLNAEGINLTLKDVNVATTGENAPAINITGGSTTIHVKGTNNRLSSKQSGGITMSNNANLTIEGDDAASSSLTVVAGSNDDRYASNVGIGASFNATCGYIKIQDITLNASGGPVWGLQLGSASIGTSCCNSICGDIEIKNSNVTVKGYYGAAAIGLGALAGPFYDGLIDTYYNKVGNIKITASTIDATIQPMQEMLMPEGVGACIGLAAAADYVNMECGTITIEDVDETTFLNNLKRKDSPASDSQSWKIGKGMINSTNKGTITFSGGTFNGTSFTDGYGAW